MAPTIAIKKQKKQKRKAIFNRLYKNLKSPAAFTSVEPLLREAQRYDRRITRKDVREYLAGEHVYTLHRKVVRKYNHMPTLAPGLHTEWQCDLADFRRVARKNGGYRYLLVCIDTLSRQIFAVPVKSKHSENMIDAFKKVFTDAGFVPWKLLSDAGLEFTAKPVQKYFRQMEIEHFCMQTSPRFHAGMAERANRSIKERLYRYFHANKTQRWVDVIGEIVNAINHSYNTSIGMRPIDITFKNAETIRRELKENALEKFTKSNRWKRRRFNIGDHVRIEKLKHVFQKGYMPNFTSEIFRVAKVRLIPHQPPTYRIRDQNGQLLRGWFYGNDLSGLAKRANNTGKLYDIERVLRERKRDGIKYVLVKWKGYGPEENSWIPANSIVHK